MTTSLLTGCGKQAEESSSEEDPVVNVATMTDMSSAEDVQVVYKEGMALSDLTGEWIDESLADQRPLCIMIENTTDAFPQSGISNADITYEFIVEGAITRLMCVFKDYSTGIDKLGPVRSSRHYYAQLAEMLEGIYAHFGWSVYAQQYIEARPEYQNLNGLELEGSVYYRDSARSAPHNVYTDSDRLVSGVETKGYNTTHSSSYNYDQFKFNISDTALNSGNAANKVTTNFISSTTSWFEYNPDDSRYYRYEFGQEHVDAETGEQLSYKNVLIMFVDYEVVDDEGRRDIHWDEGTSGSGYYVSDGEYIPITWTRYGNGITYKNEDGSQLKMNPGNTYVSVLDNTLSTATFE
jgi:hypothetical protein